MTMHSVIALGSDACWRRLCCSIRGRTRSQLRRSDGNAARELKRGSQARSRAPSPCARRAPAGATGRGQERMHEREKRLGVRQGRNLIQRWRMRAHCVATRTPPPGAVQCALTGLELAATAPRRRPARHARPRRPAEHARRRRRAHAFPEVHAPAAGPAVPPPGRAAPQRLQAAAPPPELLRAPDVRREAAPRLLQGAVRRQVEPGTWPSARGAVPGASHCKRFLQAQPRTPPGLHPH